MGITEEGEKKTTAEIQLIPITETACSIGLLLPTLDGTQRMQSSKLGLCG
jgi:hypothetical protein